MNVWRLIANREDSARGITWVREHGRIAIGGGLIGDIRERGYGSAQEIKAALKIAYPGIQNAGSGCQFLWNIARVMQPGDLVILTGSRPRELVVEVAGPYEWRSELPPLSKDANHQRRVRVSGLDPEAVWRAAGGAPAAGQSIRWTLFQVARALGEHDL